MPISSKINKNYTPLAEKMRPSSLDDFIGQEHLIGPEKPLRKLIELDKVGSLILWGPSGTGKTTLARVIANITHKRFEELSAVNAGVSDLRKIIQKALQSLKSYGEQTILFIDEVHRFNKTQQDAVLPYVENGTVRLIGSTTENPSFQVIPALRSRCQMFRMEYLSFQEIKQIVTSALKRDKGYGQLKIKIEPHTIDKIVLNANGDARFALNILETIVASAKIEISGERVVMANAVDDILQKGFIAYDKLGSEHYDHASAYQKSLRGSDPDAAIYWLAKMIAGGEDPRFIARRLIVTAAEDIGNANPLALVVANAAHESSQILGFPEARIPLSQATIYVATSPKSNSSIKAIDKALSDIEKKGKSYPVPPHLKDSHYKDASTYGFGVGYKYPHSYKGNWVSQDYLPDPLKGKTYYSPTSNGQEVNIKERMAKIHQSKHSLQNDLGSNNKCEEKEDD